MLDTLNVAAQVGTFLSALAAVVMIAVAVRTYRRQTNAQIFLEYTARYERVMESFPGDGRRARLDLQGPAPNCSEELTLAVLRYLNLCSEEFYLCRRGYLARDVWTIWEDELKRTLRSPLVRREWKQLRGEFESYPAFVEYVDAAQANEALTG
jgi:hypothetical protein